MSNAGDSTKIEITDAKLHVHIVTLSTKDSVNLTKQLNEVYKRSVYWNSCETKPAIAIEKERNLMNYLMHHFKALKDYLFLRILLEMVEMIKQLKKIIKSIFSHEERLKITSY